MLWGSDWPVVDLANGLPDWIAVTRRILDSLSQAEARAVASGTATRVYGL
jgi:predicted TIM-barrel fold metal-dependent hydrolase